MLFAEEYNTSSAESRTIAGVLLAGWTITRLAMPAGSTANSYWLQSPRGGTCGYHSTPYTAALAAERYMDEWDRNGWEPGKEGRWDTRRSA